MVRGLGPGLPLRGAGPRRPGVRQVPADPFVPGVVPAPQRRPARLRVGLRRHQPPGPGWAALEVFAIDGGRDFDFLSRIFDKLLVNFTWWVNLEDKDGSNLFEGGFLGLDNIGPIDRSHLPVGGTLEQSDATGWMASYALGMAAIAGVLNRSGHRPASDLVLKFIEHFAAIRDAMDSQGMWDDVDGLFYDRLVTPDGNVVPVKVRSMVGIIPVLAAAVIDEGMLAQSMVIAKQFPRLLRDHGSTTWTSWREHRAAARRARQPTDAARGGGHRAL